MLYWIRKLCNMVCNQPGDSKILSFGFWVCCSEHIAMCFITFIPQENRKSSCMTAGDSVLSGGICVCCGVVLVAILPGIFGVELFCCLCYMSCLHQLRLLPGFLTHCLLLCNTVGPEFTYQHDTIATCRHTLYTGAQVLIVFVHISIWCLHIPPA